MLHLRLGHSHLGIGLGSFLLAKYQMHEQAYNNTEHDSARGPGNADVNAQNTG